mmetsp:Transcript_21489/g.66629  ORF Transcript_21489/g.66629 Transcript_21489/m.66629 type:complete len:224 (-) Transcript_21489:510-1181(-)
MSLRSRRPAARHRSSPCLDDFQWFLCVSARGLGTRGARRRQGRGGDGGAVDHRARRELRGWRRRRRHRERRGRSGSATGPRGAGNGGGRGSPPARHGGAVPGAPPIDGRVPHVFRFMAADCVRDDHVVHRLRRQDPSLVHVHSDLWPRRLAGRLPERSQPGALRVRPLRRAVVPYGQPALRRERYAHSTLRTIRDVRHLCRPPDCRGRASRWALFRRATGADG